MEILKILFIFTFSGVVHEHPRIGSDGESEEGSRTSEDVVSPGNRGGANAVTVLESASVTNGTGVSPLSNVNVNSNNNANITTTSATINPVAPGSALGVAPGAGLYHGVKMRQKNNGAMGRRLTSQEEINKRLSLPADLKLPENFVEKQAVSPTLEGPLSRAIRRQSLSEIGFGRMDTYTKLDKLGEVRKCFRISRFFCCDQSQSLDQMQKAGVVLTFCVWFYDFWKENRKVLIFGTTRPCNDRSAICCECLFYKINNISPQDIYLGALIRSRKKAPDLNVKHTSALFMLCYRVKPKWDPGTQSSVFILGDSREVAAASQPRKKWSKFNFCLLFSGNLCHRFQRKIEADR